GGRHNDQITLVVYGNRRPGIAGAGWREAFGNWVPTPAELPGTCIKSPHRTIRAVHPVVVGDRRTDNDEITDYRWRRRFLVFATALYVGDASRQVDLPFGAEISAGSPRNGIKGEKAGIDRCQKDAPATGIAVGPAGIGPQRDTTVYQALRIGRLQVYLRVEAPLL